MDTVSFSQRQVYPMRKSGWPGKYESVEQQLSATTWNVVPETARFTDSSPRLSPFNHYNVACESPPQEVPQSVINYSWYPRDRNDLLHAFRDTLNANHRLVKNNQETVAAPATPSSLAIAGKTQPRSWSQAVKNPPRPLRKTGFTTQETTRSPVENGKNCSINIPECCTAPRIKLVCVCCGGEQPLNLKTKVKDELRPRIIPVATSQLGFCRFCQVNGESSETYLSHNLRSDEGRVTCPVLREYNCPICNNGGGDFAHTLKYCPLAKDVQPVY